LRELRGEAKASPRASAASLRKRIVSAVNIDSPEILDRSGPDILGQGLIGARGAACVGSYLYILHRSLSRIPTDICDEHCVVKCAFRWSPSPAYCKNVADACILNTVTICCAPIWSNH
jgi:hypothetical protein